MSFFRRKSSSSSKKSDNEGSRRGIFGIGSRSSSNSQNLSPNDAHDSNPMNPFGSGAVFHPDPNDAPPAYDYGSGSVGQADRDSKSPSGTMPGSSSYTPAIRVNAPEVPASSTPGGVRMGYSNNEFQPSASTNPFGASSSSQAPVPAAPVATSSSAGGNSPYGWAFEGGLSTTWNPKDSSGQFLEEEAMVGQFRDIISDIKTQLEENSKITGISALKQTDNVFIIQNSRLLKPIWPLVKQAVAKLGAVMIALDGDGIDLYATNFNSQAKDYTLRDDGTPRDFYRNGFYGVSNAAELNEILDQIPMEGTSCFAQRFENITNTYISQLKKRSNKPVSYIVISDGVVDDPEELLELFQGMDEELNELDLPRTQLSVQFLIFGQSEFETGVMKDIDDGKYKQDRVDCKFWNGVGSLQEILALIAGAVIKKYDKQLSYSIEQVKASRATLANQSSSLI